MGQDPWECPIKKRKIYSKEFKLEALRQWEQGGQSARAVASSLGLPRSALYKWKEQLSDLVSTDLSSGAESERHDHQHESEGRLLG